MKVIYIAGPFTAPNAFKREQNIQAAERAGLAVVEMGASPLIPHANTRNFHGTANEEFWYQATLELLRRCDAVLLVPGWEISRGAMAEKAEAGRLKIPVFYSEFALSEWLAISERAAAHEVGGAGASTAAAAVSEGSSSGAAPSPSATPPSSPAVERRGAGDGRGA